jgi:hypothetical protein
MDTDNADTTILQGVFYKKDTVDMRSLGDKELKSIENFILTGRAACFLNFPSSGTPCVILTESGKKSLFAVIS